LSAERRGFGQISTVRENGYKWTSYNVKGHAYFGEQVSEKKSWTEVRKQPETLSIVLLATLLLLFSLILCTSNSFATVSTG
jgi:hypothetical protein